ncbi:hypothetical protein ATL17_0517 [Maritalea mobilis]|uniref:Uncharacterized protein n=1 Tax=Maritalea mobilis TaxID=483324 RepID=A0A4R6VR93_9HYPH|nr:hypothetical protein ATL17_0517 [Maritalea mobilis]
MDCKIKSCNDVVVSGDVVLLKFGYWSRLKAGTATRGLAYL